MSDLLSTLAQQTLGIAPVVQPRVTSRFGPAPLILADARLALPAPSEPSPWGPPPSGLLSGVDAWAPLFSWRQMQDAAAIDDAVTPTSHADAIDTAEPLEESLTALSSPPGVPESQPSASLYPPLPPPAARRPREEIAGVSHAPGSASGPASSHGTSSTGQTTEPATSLRTTAESTAAPRRAAQPPSAGHGGAAGEDDAAARPATPRRLASTTRTLGLPLPAAVEQSAVAPTAAQPIAASTVEQPTVAPTAAQPIAASTVEQPAVAPTAAQPIAASTVEQPTVAPTAAQPIAASTVEQRAAAPAARQGMSETSAMVSAVPPQAPPALPGTTANLTAATPSPGAVQRKVEAPSPAPFEHAPVFARAPGRSTTADPTVVTPTAFQHPLETAVTAPASPDRTPGVAPTPSLVAESVTVAPQPATATGTWASLTPAPVAPDTTTITGVVEASRSVLSVGPHADTTFVDEAGLPTPRPSPTPPGRARGSPPAAPVSTVSPRMPSTAALASAMPSPASAAVAGAAETVNPVVLASRTIQRRADITAPAAAPPPEPPGTSNWAASVHGTHAVEALAVAPAAAAASPAVVGQLTPGPVVVRRPIETPATAPATPTSPLTAPHVAPMPALNQRSAAPAAAAPAELTAAAPAELTAAAPAELTAAVPAELTAAVPAELAVTPASPPSAAVAAGPAVGLSGIAQPRVWVPSTASDAPTDIPAMTAGRTPVTDQPAPGTAAHLTEVPAITAGRTPITDQPAPGTAAHLTDMSAMTAGRTPVTGQPASGTAAHLTEVPTMPRAAPSRKTGHAPAQTTLSGQAAQPPAAAQLPVETPAVAREVNFHAPMMGPAATDLPDHTAALHAFRPGTIEASVVAPETPIAGLVGTAVVDSLAGTPTAARRRGETPGRASVAVFQDAAPGDGAAPVPTANPDTITMRGPQAPTPGAASPAAAAVDPTASIPAGRQRIAEVAAITPTPHPPSPIPQPPSPIPQPPPPIPHPPLRITIGRIDVRVTAPPPAASTRREPSRPTVSLDDYLRGGGSPS